MPASCARVSAAAKGPRTHFPVNIARRADVRARRPRTREVSAFGAGGRARIAPEYIPFAD